MIKSIAPFLLSRRFSLKERGDMYTPSVKFKIIVSTVSTLLLFIATSSVALMITVEPDDYAAGYNLTEAAHITPYVTLTTTGGAPVYAAPIGTPSSLEDTGPFGERVFSRTPDDDSQWMILPDYVQGGMDIYQTFSANEWAKDPGGLMIRFNFQVDYVSTLGLGLNGWVPPTSWYVYDSNDILIHYGWHDYYSGESLGPLVVGEDYGEYYWWEMAFAHGDIRTVIISGESEPTTLDRLTFRVVPTPVNEPLTGLLLLSGLIGIMAYRKTS